MGQWCFDTFFYILDYEWFNSSHPDELSLKLLSIFKISFSVAGSKIKGLVLLVTIYSVGHFFDEGMFFANDVPTSTKNVLNLLDTTCPYSVIIFLILCFFKYSCTNIFHRRSLYTFFSNSIITFELSVYWFIFPFIDDSLNHLPRFCHVSLMSR